MSKSTILWVIVPAFLFICSEGSTQENQTLTSTPNITDTNTSTPIIIYSDTPTHTPSHTDTLVSTYTPTIKIEPSFTPSETSTWTSTFTTVITPTNTETQQINPTYTNTSESTYTSTYTETLNITEPTNTNTPMQITPTPTDTSKIPSNAKPNPTLIPVAKATSSQQKAIAQASILSDFTWLQSSSSAAFSPRFFQSSFVFNNNLWVMAGSDSADGGGNPLNDVWSTNGSGTWNLGTNSAAFDRRQGQQCVVFNNKIWMIGGIVSDFTMSNEVWSSTDGVNWSLVANAPFSERYNFGLVEHDGYLWVIAGNNYWNYLNDVWKSANGVEWTQVTSSANFSQRDAPQALSYGGKLWVLGGFDASISNGSNDVWSSMDGATWTQVTGSAGWAPRLNHRCLVYDDQMWVAGGSDLGGSVYSDAWSSSDGVNWTQMTTEAPWSSRERHSVDNYDGRIYVMAGNNQMTLYNDVWKSDPPLNVTPNYTPINSPIETPGETPITPTDTPTECPVLSSKGVTSYKQCNGWGGLPIPRYVRAIPGVNTICKIGCYLTSVSMADTREPGVLDEFLSNSRCFSRGGGLIRERVWSTLNWNEQVLFYNMEWITNEESDKCIRSLLNGRYWVLVRLVVPDPTDPKKEHLHTVVITGSTINPNTGKCDLRMEDPGSRNTDHSKEMYYLSERYANENYCTYAIGLLDLNNLVTE